MLTAYRSTHNRRNGEQKRSDVFESSTRYTAFPSSRLTTVSLITYTSKCNDNVSYLFRQLELAEEYNVKLRKALAIRLSNMPPEQANSLRDANNVGQDAILCHTPHFLGIPDRNELLRNPMSSKVVGYQRSGCF